MVIDEFKRSCIHYKPDVVVQRFLIESPTYFFIEIQPDKEFDFKKDIATCLGVHVRDIVIVGSGKLGFSLKPDDSSTGLYLFKEFDYNYHRDHSTGKSDLDVAIISSYLFDKELRNLYDHTNQYKEGGSFDKARKKNFAYYILKGRFAIRFLPIDFSMTKEIAAVQEKYKSEYGRDINIEIYKSWHFFETYHGENIQNIQLNLL